MNAQHSGFATYLSTAGVIVPPEVIATWTEEQYWQAHDWAMPATMKFEAAIVDMAAMPEFLRPYAIWPT